MKHNHLFRSLKITNMIDIINDFELDKDNLEFNYAVEFVLHTDRLVFVTGKAGTGKTTFLKYIKDKTNKNTVIVAPTGAAAINAGGVTINSFFQIPFGPFIFDDKRLRFRSDQDENKETIFSTFRYGKAKQYIIENLELLIIDEVSMVRADTLDVIDQILRNFRKKPYLPFGGVQVVLIGDTYQLSPVVKNNTKIILSQFYKTNFFFSSRVIKRNLANLVVIELTKIYRQKDNRFIELLNRVRLNKLNDKDYEVLNSKCNPSFCNDGSDYITLATHNKTVNETNKKKLDELLTESFTYKANITGEFLDSQKPTSEILTLKVGAQVMVIKNDSQSPRRYFNGKIGRVKSLYNQKICVEFDEGKEIELERVIWENVKYIFNKENKKIEEVLVGTFEQFPLKLAWAITVHKSQGLTFEKVFADLGNAFDPGQVYVALSRCTSLEGLVLKSPIGPEAIKVDPVVLEFERYINPNDLMEEKLINGKVDFYYKKAGEYLFNGDTESASEYFKRAVGIINLKDQSSIEPK